jgi:hypothetical protein
MKNISELYNATFKKNRGKAKDGFIRPTLSQYFMSNRDFVEVSSGPILREKYSLNVWPVFFVSTYIGNNKFVCAFRDNNNNQYGTIVLGTINDGVITYDTPIVFNPYSTKPPSITYNSTTDTVVVVFEDDDDGGTYNASCIVFDVSSGSIVQQNKTNFYAYSDIDITSLDDNRILLCYNKNSNNNPCATGAIVNGTITINDDYEKPTFNQYNVCEYIGNDTAIFMAQVYNDGNMWGEMTAVDTSSNTLTYSDTYIFNGTGENSYNNSGKIVSVGAGKFLIAYEKYVESSFKNYVELIEFDGTDFTKHDSVKFNEQAGSFGMDYLSGKLIISRRDGDDNYKGKIDFGIIQNNSIEIQETIDLDTKIASNSVSFINENSAIVNYYYGIAPYPLKSVVINNV